MCSTSILQHLRSTFEISRRSSDRCRPIHTLAKIWRILYRCPFRQPFALVYIGSPRMVYASRILSLEKRQLPTCAHHDLSHVVSTPVRVSFHSVERYPDLLTLPKQTLHIQLRKGKNRFRGAGVWRGAVWLALYTQRESSCPATCPKLCAGGAKAKAPARSIVTVNAQRESRYGSGATRAVL